MKRLKEFDVKNKKVLVRCDFDVPLSEEGEILDDFRIRQALPTIEFLINCKAKVILMGHAGRPHGKIVESLTLAPVQRKLAEYLNVAVLRVPDCIGFETEKFIKKMAAGDVLLLENLRFHKEEEENNEEFAGKLAKLGDFYINNAFANSHRNHASMTGIPKYLPSAAGFTLEKEIEVLTKLTESPRRPLVAVIGGVKVEATKLSVINKFSEIGDWVLIGDLIKRGIVEKGITLDRPEKIIEPLSLSPEKDLDNETVNRFKEKIYSAKTVFWNGPLGKIEEKEFSRGSEEIAKAIIGSGAFSVIGGGDTIGFLDRLGLIGKFSYVSTGGGAMLEFLSGRPLPGLEALD